MKVKGEAEVRARLLTKCPYPTCGEKLRHINIYGNPKFVVGWCFVHGWVFTKRKRGGGGEVYHSKVKEVVKNDQTRT